MSDLPALPVYGFRADTGGLLSLAITIALPIVVGLVTRRSTSATTKAVLLLTLAAVKVVLEAWLQAVNTGADFEVIPLIYTTAINLAIAVAIHFGLYRPTGITDAAQRSLVTDRPPPHPQV